MHHTVIMGHSIISHLIQHIHNTDDHRLSPDFRLKNTCSVEMLGSGGLTVHSLLHDSQILQMLWNNLEHQPEVILLQVGGNDFRLGTTAEDLALEMLGLAALLKGRFRVKLIMFMHLLPRFTGTRVGKKWALSTKEAADYNRWTEQVVRQQSEAFEGIPYISTWNHHDYFSFGSCRRHLFDTDGIHLSNQGHFKLYKSLRGALMVAGKKLQGKG